MTQKRCERAVNTYTFVLTYVLMTIKSKICVKKLFPKNFYVKMLSQ